MTHPPPSAPQSPLEAWEALLRQAIAKDFDEQQHALFQIGLVLERHHQPNQDAPGLYEENLSRELRRLVLDEKRQAAAVVYLAALVRNQPSQAESFLYTLGRARPALTLVPLLTLLHERGATWDAATAYQAVNVLEACVKTNPAALVTALRAQDPTALLDLWAEHSDHLLADKADRLLDKIEDLLDSRGD